MQTSDESKNNSSDISLREQIILAWSNPNVLGELAHKASVDELIEATSCFSPEQIAHVKDAANKMWKPGVEGKASFANYMGEKVQIWEVGSGRDITVKTMAGTVLKVKRVHLQPWLGI